MRAERNLQQFHKKYGHPLGYSVKGFEDRLEKQELCDQSAVSPVPPHLVRHFMEGHEDKKVTVRQRPPGHPEGRAAEARADVVVANDYACNLINDTKSCYLSLFLNDLSDALDDSSKLKDNNTIALLGSSTSTDSLTLMHNRTGHFNMKALIESHKSKLVKGLKIEDSHIRRFNKSDKHVCDVCARAKITRMAFKKVHAVRGKNLGDYIYLWTSQCLSIVRRGRVTVMLFNSSTTRPSTAGSIR